MINHMQQLHISPPINIGRFHHSKYSVRDIFLDNHNWDRYYFHHKAEIREVERIEVEKMLTCKDCWRGYFVCYCKKCNEVHELSFGCNSRLCSNCGKRYTDRWAKNLSKKMFDVVHRHTVMSLPDKLWGVTQEHRGLLKVLMDSAIKALGDTLSYCLRKEILPGAIVVLHPFGRDLKFCPHVHVIMTEGGFDKRGKFIRKAVIPYTPLRKTWQYQVLTNFKRALPQTREYAILIDRLFKEYPKGFYVYSPKESRIKSKRKVSRYVGRYIRHPAIANSRIYDYDGRTVTFWWLDHKNVKHYRTMSIDEFIYATEVP